MILFPAIDIMNKRCVRLLHGKREQVTDYGEPRSMARHWQSLGAEYLHIVDLDAAFDGVSDNGKVIAEIVKECKIPIQLGGGIRTLELAKYVLDEVGVTRAIVGTAACTNQDVVENMCRQFGNRIVGGIDIKDGFVAVKGWVEKSTLKPLELALKLKALGVTTIVFTDISRDGALTGINVKETADLMNASGMDIIASGGMHNLDDIKQLLAANMYGAILGKSLYDKKIDFADARRIVKNG